jgi:flagellar biosynthesis chaperone FliJ
MVEPLGKAMYRGLLKTVARVWKPNEIRDPALLEKVLTSMQSAAHSFRRIEAAQERTGSETMNEILKSLGIRSLANLNDFEKLRQLVLRIEEKADQINSA